MLLIHLNGKLTIQITLYTLKTCFQNNLLYVKITYGVIFMHLPDMNVAKDRTKKANIYIKLNDNYKKVFDNKRFFIRTYGCQMNVHDSEAIRKYLLSLGFIETTRVESANLIVLNTCAIRENARDKVIGFLGKCKYLKKNREDVKIVIAGCMSEQPDFIKLIEKKYNYVDIINYI